MEIDDEMFLAIEDHEPVEQADDFDPDDEGADFVPVKAGKAKFTLYMAS